jgi:hypothetical protein
MIICEDDERSGTHIGPSHVTLERQEVLLCVQRYGHASSFLMVRSSWNCTLAEAKRCARRWSCIEWIQPVLREFTHFVTETNTSILALEVMANIIGPKNLCRPA